MQSEISGQLMRREFQVGQRMGRSSKEVTWAADYDLSKEELWDRVRSPGLLAGSIPMLAEWKANGVLQAGQTGREIHSFLPGIKTPYSWRMNSYVPGERWSMFSVPEKSTLFNLPHYTEYKVFELDRGRSSRLEIKFNAQLKGIFSLRPLSRAVTWMMRKTVRDLLQAIGNRRV